MIDAELQGRVPRKHMKALQSAFLSAVFLAQQRRSGEPSDGDGAATAHVCVTSLPPNNPRKQDSKQAHDSVTRLIQFVYRGSSRSSTPG